MAPVLSRSLTPSSLQSLPYSPLFSSKSNTSTNSTNRLCLLKSSGLTCSGLKWKVDKRVGNSVVVRCEAEKETSDAPGETYEYQAEVHSLYSHKEIFLRELVSNASDALDKLRFSSVTDPSLLGDAGDLEIRIKPDPELGTITISDTGIGMTREELIDCLGTIAQSGTSKFLNALKENKDLGNDNSLIGQFGVGFYSAFLVADKVRVSTKSPRSDKQYIWEAAADSSSYVIKEETDPAKQISRGTEITLYLKDDDKYEFTEPSRVQGLVKNYSQFVSFPIYTWQEKSRTVEVEEEEEPKEGEETPPEGATIDLKLPRRSLQVHFTCDACGVRSQRLINRLAYEKGLVYVQCSGCSQYHKLVDNLNLMVEYDFREEINASSDTDQA